MAFSTILIPVTDLATARHTYKALLGVDPSVDESYYVAFDIDGVHIGLNPQGAAQGLTAPVAYMPVDDLEAKMAELSAAGVTVGEVKKVGPGRQIVHVTDADGNTFGLMHDS